MRSWACQQCGLVLSFMTKINGVEKAAAFAVKGQVNPPMGMHTCVVCGNTWWVEVTDDHA